MLIPLDVPLGWSDPASVNLFHAILLLGGVPLLLFVAITVAVYLPAVVRGERVAPGHAPMEDQWLGGPSAGPAALTAGSSAPQLSGQPRDRSGDRPEDQTGGASGRW